MQITTHFSLAEFTRSESAKRHGVSNDPTPEHLMNITVLCNQVLEPVRVKFGPLNISSGYRSKVLNHYIGGALSSQHCEGKAADIDQDDMPNSNNVEIFHFIKNNLEFDQLIWEKGNDKNPDWVHVSFREGANRNQIKKYKNGKYIVITK